MSAPARVVSLQPKQPPHSIEAEQSVLGGLMLNNAAWFELAGKLEASDFYRADHQVIYDGIGRLIEAGKACDFVTLSEALRTAQRLDDVGGLSYLGSLVVDTYSVANLVAYAEIVRERSLRRRVIALCADVGDAAFGRGDTEDLAGMLTAGAESLMRAQGSQSKKFSELLKPLEDYFRQAREKTRAGGILGVATGLPGLDKVTGGIYGPRVYGIAARPGTGKTAILNQIAFHAASRGHPGFVASLEMSDMELMVRGLSAYSRKNVTRLFHGNDGDTEAAMEAAVRLGDLPLWLATETYSLDAILAQITLHKARHGIQWAAIDHVGLIETPKFNSRNDQIGHITRRIKQTAKRLGIPIICLFQMSRLSEKENRLPGLHDLRDSGNIEQDLDVALFLHVKPEARDKPVKPVLIGLLKNRNGRVGWMKETYEFDGSVQTFREIATDYATSYSEPEGA